MRWRLTTVFVCIAIASCATPYQEMGHAGGFEQRMIAEDFYVIKFHGNGFTSPERVKDFSMLRAAEIGHRLGFTHFVLAGQQDQSSRELITTGTRTNTTGTVYGTGNYATYSGTSNTYANTIPVFKPGIEIGVKYFEGPPTGRFLEVFRVDEVLSRLREEYDIESE